MKFEIVINYPGEKVTTIVGKKVVGDNEITDEEMHLIIPIEILLEKLTGFRFHINQVQ